MKDNLSATCPEAEREEVGLAFQRDIAERDGA